MNIRTQWSNLNMKEAQELKDSFTGTIVRDYLHRSDNSEEWESLISRSGGGLEYFPICFGYNVCDMCKRDIRDIPLPDIGRDFNVTRFQYQCRKLLNIKQ